MAYLRYSDQETKHWRRVIEELQSHLSGVAGYEEIDYWRSELDHSHPAWELCEGICTKMEALLEESMRTEGDLLRKMQVSIRDLVSCGTAEDWRMASRDYSEWDEEHGELIASIAFALTDLTEGNW